MARKLKLKASAKINLWLEVLFKRNDGYHELSTLMVPLDWGDELTFEQQERGIEVFCSDVSLGNQEENLAYRAAKLFFAHAKPSCFRGVTICLEKKIPVGAGLGGGSSDAATVLRGLNILGGSPLSTTDLKNLALQLGADVPFFVEARPALARGVGERLTPLKTEGPNAEIPPLWFVIVKPDFAISTAYIYRNLKLTKRSETISIACLQEAPDKWQEYFRNDLEQVAVSLFPEIEAIKEALLERGALAALMTGSGSAVYGAYKEREKAFLAQEKLMAIWPGFQILAARGAY